MELQWPGSLYLLGLIPLLIAFYIWILRKRRRYAVRYSSLSLVRQALPQSSRWRRHLPFALFSLALASLIMAFARPQAEVTVPSRRATIILAIDVSRSMCSTDIPPNRLEAAKDAAMSFVENQEATTRIGIVAFGGFAELIQEPTNDLELLRDAIERLGPARRTAIGSAIIESLNVIAEIDSNIAPLTTDGSTAVTPEPLPEGEFVPHIIVLLTDGVSNSGPYPIDVAQEAALRGVRVYTIGFGTSNPGSMRNCSQFGSSGFGSEQFFQSGGGGGFRRGIDEPTLMQIANMTGGEYYSATSAGELQDVFRDLPTYLITVKEFIEISFIFTTIGAFLAALAIVLAMIWNPIS
jgi:Ca-activated chloride channel family protein